GPHQRVLDEVVRVSAAAGQAHCVPPEGRDKRYHLILEGIRHLPTIPGGAAQTPRDAILIPSPPRAYGPWSLPSPACGGGGSPSDHRSLIIPEFDTFSRRRAPCLLFYCGLENTSSVPLARPAINQSSTGHVPATFAASREGERTIARRPRRTSEPTAA